MKLRFFEKPAQGRRTRRDWVTDRGMFPAAATFFLQAQTRLPTVRLSAIFEYRCVVTCFCYCDIARDRTGSDGTLQPIIEELRLTIDGKLQQSQHNFWYTAIHSMSREQACRDLSHHIVPAI